MNTDKVREAADNIHAITTLYDQGRITHDVLLRLLGIRIALIKSEMSDG